MEQEGLETIPVHPLSPIVIVVNPENSYSFGPSSTPTSSAPETPNQSSSFENYALEYQLHALQEGESSQENGQEDEVVVANRRLLLVESLLLVGITLALILGFYVAGRFLLALRDKK